MLHTQKAIKGKKEMDDLCAYRALVVRPKVLVQERDNVGCLTEEEVEKENNSTRNAYVSIAELQQSDYVLEGFSVCLYFRSYCRKLTKEIRLQENIAWEDQRNKSPEKPYHCEQTICRNPTNTCFGDTSIMLKTLLASKDKKGGRNIWYSL